MHPPANICIEGAAPSADSGNVADSSATDEGCVVFLLGIAPRHNAAQPTDVDHSGSTNAADALALVEVLRGRRDGRSLSEGAGQAKSYNVNDDGVITPVDLLHVVNQLMADAQQEQDRLRALRLAQKYVLANELDWGEPTGAAKYEPGSSERRIGRYIVGFPDPPEAQFCLCTDMERALLVWPTTGEVQGAPTG